MSQWVTVGAGSIICAGAVLTCNISLGRHTHINLSTTIGHDTTAGDFFTTAPGASISGNCSFGNEVYIGSNACIREKTTVTGGVTIGMGAVVVKSIAAPGVYAGNPAQKIS
jgi:acetyltransferase-like isoleucine patch superfamily enzyme